jgi:hypothetical protein
MKILLVTDNGKLSITLKNIINKEGKMKNLVYSTLLIFVLFFAQIANAESPPGLNHQTLKEVLSVVYHKGHKEYQFIGFLGVQELSNTYKVAYFLLEAIRQGKTLGYYQKNKAHIKYLTNDLRPKYDGWYISLIEIGVWRDSLSAKFYAHPMTRIDKESLEKLKKKYLKK